MKKLLILVFVAAIIGVVISRGQRPSDASGTAADDTSMTGPASTVPPQAPEALVTAPAPAAQPQPQAPPAEPEPPKLALKQEPPAAQAPPLLSAVTMLLPSRAAAAPKPAVTDGPSGAPDAVAQAQALLKAGKRAEARALLTPLYLAAKGQRAAQIRIILDAISRELVFNPRCTEGAIVHVVSPGDVLVRIGKKYNVNWRMVMRLNGLNEDSVLRLGQKLKVLEGRASIVVHKSEYRLTLLWNGAYVKEYPIGIGKAESPTPEGEFVVDETLVHPVWTRPDGVLVKYGEPGYALGERWMGFADEPGAFGIGIHGTNEENTVGTMCSNGCVRLRNADVLELYDFVTVGTHVTIEE